MNNERNGRAGSGEAASERALRQLFARAEPREAPPEADTEAIRAAVYAEWDVLTGRRILRRRLVAVAAAASVVAIVGFLVVDRTPPPVLPTLAHVERLQGTVSADVDGSRIAALRVGDAITQGTTLMTGSGGIALRLGSGGSLRLATETTLTLAANARVELKNGALYFDSENSGAGEPLTVMTSLGNVSDVGTQFITELELGSLAIGVRDGGVMLARGTEQVGATAGEKLTVRDAVPVQRESVSTFGGDWQWTERLAPPFDIDGRRLIDFLEWVAAQTGRTLVFSDPQAERVARETVLSGSIDLEPLPKLTAVLALTDLGYAIEGGRIAIEMK